LFGEGGGGLDPTGEWEVLEMLKNTKIRKSWDVEQVKKWRNNQPIYLETVSFTGRIDGEEDAAVLGGGGDVIDPSAAVARCAGWIRVQKFVWEGEGKHNK
jgi:hypothetical protein